MSIPKINLEQVIPDGKVRQRIYQGFAGLGLALGAAAVGYGVIPGVDLPTPLTVANAVYVFLAGSGFLVAQANTPTERYSGE